MASINTMFAAEVALCVKEISLPESLLENAFREMGKLLKTMDPESDECKKLSYYAQILHSAILSIHAAGDIASGLSLLMLNNSNNEQL